MTSVFQLPAPLQLPGTLWTPQTVELTTRDHGLMVVERQVYSGAEYPTQGPALARFARTYFKATRGFHSGKPLALRRHQREVMDGIMRLDPETGERLVRTAIIPAPRKWGKSQVAAPLALWFLLVEAGDGAPEVYGAAGDRKQASLVFKEVRTAVLQNPELRKVIKVYRDALEVLEGPTAGGVFRALSADAGLAQGLNPSCVLADEVGTWYGSDLWFAMTEGMAARRNPLVVAISTPGFDRNSLYWGLCDYGARVNSGELDDPTFYYRPFAPRDPEADWQHPLTWLEANPGLGDYLNIKDFESSARRTPESEFRRFRLSQWVQSSKAWLRQEDWDGCADPEAVIEPGEECVLMVDGSWSGDSTAAVLATPDGRVGIARLPGGELAIWEKPAIADDSWRVPIGEVEDAIKTLAETYRLSMVAFDPFRWQRTMDAMREEGFLVVEFNTSVPARMVKAGNRFETAVRNRFLRHSGEPVLTRHIMATALKVDRLGPRPVKAALSKIDAGICAVVGYELATQHRDAPPEVAPVMVQNPWG